jgi:hypothetical protein
MMGTCFDENRMNLNFLMEDQKALRGDMLALVKRVGILENANQGVVEAPLGVHAENNRKMAMLQEAGLLSPRPSMLGGAQQGGYVAMNTWASLNTKPTGVIGPDSNAKKIMDYKNFIEALLDLDCYALNVTEEVRNAARKVLGR